MVSTKDDFSKFFKEPNEDTWITIASYIPPNRGDPVQRVVGEYKINDVEEQKNMRAVLVVLEADPFVHDITIARIYKVHKNVHR